ncbi:MAG: hypothetical protein LBN04_10480 [Oscillospiraceae bacterium]|jgi:tetratricopeptide (TPR) repeat protein|nr:hypothetical protein [Oscillospiraceae bacterium]
MDKNATMGQVIPFARSASYLRRLAMKQRAQAKPVQALEMLRLSLSKARDANTIMEMAQTYAEMQCPALSNRALFSLMEDEDHAAEGLYGAGCNFYAVHMNECARDCLVLYLQKRPDGAYAQDAAELIESIDTEMPTGSPLDLRINGRMDRVLSAMEGGKPRLASRLIRRALALEQRNSAAHALQAFTFLAAGNGALALAAARRAMRCNKQDIRALCALAAALHAVGCIETGRGFLKRAVARIENDEDSQLVCQTACEMGEHRVVLDVLTPIESEAPLNDEILHLTASASYNAGEREEALHRWRLLRRIDPMDSIAEYRLQSAEADTLPAMVSYSRQVPLSETLARLGQLRTWVQDGPEAVLALWQRGDALEKLLRWGLTSAESGVAQAMMGVLAGLGDARARDILREALTEPTLSDALKHHALAALCVAGSEGPHYALMHGRMALVRVSRMEKQAGHPQEDALMRLLRARLGAQKGAEKALLSRLCQAAVSLGERRSVHFQAQAVAMAFDQMRGLPPEAAPPGKRRKLARLARRVIKEAYHGMHQF